MQVSNSNNSILNFYLTDTLQTIDNSVIPPSDISDTEGTGTVDNNESILFSTGEPTYSAGTYNAKGQMAFISGNNVSYLSASATGTNVSLGDAKTIAKNITSAFEGGQVTGNFDGQGISIGYLQWNIGSGTLQPLLKDMATTYKKDFDTIFSAKVAAGKDKKGNIIYKTQADILRDVLYNKTESQQLSWAKSINDGKNQISNPWKASFSKLVENKKFISIEDNKAKDYLNRATTLVEKDFVPKTVRAYALMFDTAVQNWSLGDEDLIRDSIAGKSTAFTNKNSKAYKNLNKQEKAVVDDLMVKIKNEKNADKKALYYIAAAVAIKSKDDSYAMDTWSRKSTIVAGNGIVHGTKLNLDSKFGLNDKKLIL